MKYFTIIIMLSMLAGCVTDGDSGEQINQEYTTGTLENRTYNNDYFGFTLDIPSNWRIVSAEEYAIRNQEVIDDVKTKVDNFEGRKKYFENLLVLEKDMTVDSLYALLVFMSEDNKKLNQNPKEYLEYGEEYLNKARPNQYPIYEFSPIKTQSTIGGKEFLAQPSFIWFSPDNKRNKITYCQEIRDHLLVVVLDGFTTKAEVNDAKKLLNAIKWNAA